MVGGQILPRPWSAEKMDENELSQCPKSFRRVLTSYSRAATALPPIAESEGGRVEGPKHERGTETQTERVQHTKPQKPKL